MEINHQQNKKDNNNNSNEHKEIDINKNYSNDNNDYEANIKLNLLSFSKRSNSCKVNEVNKKKFSGAGEYKEKIENIFVCLKTPQLKPKKCELNPIPLNIGTNSAKKKSSRFKPINDEEIDKNIFNDIISEDDKEGSNKYSSDSDSDSLYSNEEQLNMNNEINNKINNEKQIINDINVDNFSLMKIHSENRIL